MCGLYEIVVSNGEKRDTSVLNVPKAGFNDLGNLREMEPIKDCDS